MKILRKTDVDWKFVWQVGGCLIASILTGFLLIVLAYMLPTDRIRQNVAVDSEMILKEGVYYQWTEGYKSAQADSYSDASLFLDAMYPGSGNVIRDAMNVPRLLYGEDDNETSVVRFARGEEGETHIENYGRYWHGSLIFFKPLLSIFSVSDIRMLSMIVQTGLLLIIIMQLVRRKKEDALPGFFLAIIMINPVTMIICSKYSVEYILTLFMIAFQLHFHEKLMIGKRYYFYFLINGICMVYFGELSFPMIALGFPLVIYLLLSRENMTKQLKKELLFTIIWGIGYVLMWLGKWVLAWLFTGYNYLQEAINQATRYTSDHATWETEDPSVIDRILRNVNVYLKWPFAILFLIMLGCVLFYLFRNRKKISRNSRISMLPYMVPVLLPFGVFIALGNGYSYVHYWLSHRLLSITAFAGICMLLQLAGHREAAEGITGVKREL